MGEAQICVHEFEKAGNVELEPRPYIEIFAENCDILGKEPGIRMTNYPVL